MRFLGACAVCAQDDKGAWGDNGDASRLALPEGQGGLAKRAEIAILNVRIAIFRVQSKEIFGCAVINAEKAVHFDVSAFRDLG